MPPVNLPRPNGTYGVSPPVSTPPRALPASNRPHSPKSVKSNPADHKQKDEKNAADQRNKELARDFAAQMLSLGAIVPRQMLPQSFYQVTVTVKGGPQASLRRLWYLACAAAFGRYLKSGFVSGRATAINGDWDVSGKAVTISLAQTETGIANAGFFGGDSGLRVLMDGPDQETVGANWPAPIVRGSPSLEQIAAIGAAVTAANAIRAAGRALADVEIAGTRVGQAAIEAANLQSDVLIASTAAGLLADQYRKGLISITPKTQPALRRFFLSRRDVRVDPHRRVLFWNNDGPGAEALSLSDAASGASQGTGLASLSISNPTSAAYTRSVGPAGGYTVTRDGADVGLIDAGRHITTGSRNVGQTWGTPRPSVDGISRSHPLDMITAALVSPGYTTLATDGSTLASSGQAVSKSAYPGSQFKVVTAYNPSGVASISSLSTFTVTPLGAPATPVTPKESPAPEVPGGVAPETTDERIRRLERGG